jgi:hypothetical protein
MVTPADRTDVRSHLVAALVAVCSAVLMTWPLAANAGHQVLRSSFFWDAYTNAMIMGSRVDAVMGRAHLSLYDNYFFAPLPDSIVFNENHFGLSLLFAPFYLLCNNPLLAYNLTLLLSLALSVFFTYLFVLRLTGNASAGLVAGVAFAFCPYVLFEIGRIQLVASQWIPACFLFLHRAVEQRRPRDIVGFWLCILLQVGTCLYYAMFLVPLLTLTACVLVVRNRPTARFFCWFGAGAVAAGLVALLMVYPYFSARGAFDLERSLAFASGYDGRLSFFTYVSETNRTLTGLHHRGAPRGAHEEIAFPGSTVLLLSLLALVVPAWRKLGSIRAKQAVATILAWAGLAVAAGVVTLLGHTMLLGAVVFVGGAWLHARGDAPHPFGGQRGLYFAVLLLAVAMFLGLSPGEWKGAPVRGLYYYFHTYFPGFNGIRKVSRQAVMTTFVACVLAGFGGAWLLLKLRRRAARVLVTTLLLGSICYELRSFPHPVESVWAGTEVPAVLHFVATLPAGDLVAFVPQDSGRQRFRGDAGMALHNYLALYHKHRFVNGQSSWDPPVTALARRALQKLPDEGAVRALLSIGTRHIVVFGEDLGSQRAELPAELAARPGEYRRVFQEGSHSVFTLLNADDPALELLETPALPALARLVPPTRLRARSPLMPELAGLALDGQEDTYWTGGRFQAPGQYFEVELAEPRQIVALEIDAPGRVMDVPVSYRLSAAKGGEALREVALQPVLRLYREQIFSPATFVFRVVLPQPTLMDRLRITVVQPVPGHYFSIHALRLYAD